MEEGMMKRGAQKEEGTGVPDVVKDAVRHGQFCEGSKLKKQLAEENNVRQNVEKPVEKVEQKVKGKSSEIVVDEKEIMKEFDEPVQKSRADLLKERFDVWEKERVVDMSVYSELHPRAVGKSRDEKIAEIVEQGERGKYFSRDWMLEGDVAQGRRCVVKRVVNDSGLEAAFKGVREGSGRKELDALKKEARIITELAKEGSKYTPAFAISDVNNEENPGIYTEFGPLSKEAVMNLSVEEKLRLIEKMADPIARLHAKGHHLLDIKLENYRFRENGDPMFVDIESRRASGLRELSQSILNSMSMGAEDVEQAAKTLICMAPELAKGSLKNIEGKEHLADVYSLGVSLYGLLMREYPLGVRPENLTDNIELIRELGEEKAKGLNDYLMEKVFSKDSSKRPQSVEEFVSGLREVVGYFDDVEEADKLKSSAEITREKYDLSKRESDVVQQGDLEKKVGDLENVAENVDVGVLEVAGESARTLGGVLKKVGVFGYHMLHPFAGTFVLPTAIRSGLKNKEYWSQFRNFGLLGKSLLFAGFLIPGSVYFGVAVGKGYEDEALMASLVGQGISGGYEFVRAMRNKVKVRKEKELEKILEKTGMSLEEYKERESRQKQIYRDLKNGDLSRLVTEGTFTYEFEIKERGFEIFKNQIGSEYRSPKGTYQAIIKTGLAYDEESAKKVMDIINGVFNFGSSFVGKDGLYKVFFDKKKAISVRGGRNQEEEMSYALRTIR